MRKDSELDWEKLERSWRAQPTAVPVPAALLRRVRRQEWRLRLGAAADWLGAAAFAGFALYLIAMRFSAFNLFWGLVLLSLAAWALVFSVGNRRGLWSPLGESAREYLDLALLRVARRRRALIFMWLLFAVELVIFALWELLALSGWLPWRVSSFGPRLYGLLGIALAVMLVWSGCVMLRVRREARHLEKLRREIDAPL
jgi:hypothetical protein